MQENLETEITDFRNNDPVCPRGKKGAGRLESLQPMREIVKLTKVVHLAKKPSREIDPNGQKVPCPGSPEGYTLPRSARQSGRARGLRRKQFYAKQCCDGVGLYRGVAPPPVGARELR